MTVAALDYGRRRIGIAIADPTGTIVRPLTVIERHSLSRDLESIRNQLTELAVTEIVVGLPLNMDGSVGPAAKAAETFAAQVAEATGLPVHLYDERLTTFEAEERLRAVSRRKNSKASVDSVAACVILEGWLREHERQNRGS